MKTLLIALTFLMNLSAFAKPTPYCIGKERRAENIFGATHFEIYCAKKKISHDLVFCYGCDEGNPTGETVLKKMKTLGYHYLQTLGDEYYLYSNQESNPEKFGIVERSAFPVNKVDEKSSGFAEALRTHFDDHYRDRFFQTPTKGLTDYSFAHEYAKNWKYTPAAVFTLDGTDAETATQLLLYTGEK